MSTFASALCRVFSSDVTIAKVVLSIETANHDECFTYLLNKYTVFQKSDAKIQITITMAHLIRINYPLSSFNYRLSGTNVANFNKIHHMLSEQQLFKQVAQLSQRDRAAGWVSNGQKWKTGTERQYLRTI